MRWRALAFHPDRRPDPGDDLGRLDSDNRHARANDDPTASAHFPPTVDSSGVHPGWAARIERLWLVFELWEHVQRVGSRIA